jgi:hypothetical protein
VDEMRGGLNNNAGTARGTEHEPEHSRYVGAALLLATPYPVVGSNITDTRLHPHRGHLSRLASHAQN